MISRSIQHHIHRPIEVISRPPRQTRTIASITLRIRIQVIHEPHIRFSNRARQTHVRVIRRRSAQQARDVLEAKRDVVEMLHAIGDVSIPEALIEAVGVDRLRVAALASVELAHFAAAGDHDEVAADVSASSPLGAAV